ncbi:hypothetical protein Tco_0391199 [Tanacetum coccineum]
MRVPKPTMFSAYLEKSEGMLMVSRDLDFLKRNHLKHNQHSLLLPTSEVPNEPQTDSSPAQTSENLRDHSSSDKSISGNEGDMTLQSVYDLCLSICAQVSDQAKEIQHLRLRSPKAQEKIANLSSNTMSMDAKFFVSLEAKDSQDKRFSKKH